MGKIIIVDASGSMAEEGKKSVVRYILYTIENLLKDEWSETACPIFLWNNDVSEYEGKVDFQGQSSSKSFEKFLKQHPNSELLLISDGSYPEDVKSVLKKSDNKMKVLMVGCDCNKARLQKMVGSENLYDTTDVATCLEDFMNV